MVGGDGLCFLIRESLLFLFLSGERSVNWFEMGYGGCDQEGGECL
jgi:hypothetical protein